MNSLLAFLPVLPLPLLVWILPLCWLLHSIEEVIMIDRWEMGREVEHRVIADRSLLAQWILYIHSISRGPLVIAALITGIGVVGVTVAGTLDAQGFGGWLYAMVLGGFFLRGFLHLGESIVLRGYTPGLLSGLFVVVPCLWYIFYRLFDSELLDLKSAALSSLIGLAVFVPVAFGIRMLLRSIFSSPQS